MENVKILIILTSVIGDSEVRATLYLIGKGSDQNSSLTVVLEQNVLPSSSYRMKLHYKTAFIKDFIIICNIFKNPFRTAQ